MEWLWFLFVGLIAGILAKAIMPGRANEPSGWLLTILLGIAGAFVGGWIGTALFNADPNRNMLMSIIFATLGAIVIIAVMRLFTGRRAV